MDLISLCALCVAKVVWRPGHGRFAFTVVCKATFELRPDVSPLAAAQEPVVEADVPSGEAGGLALASELVPFKRRPEVLLAGQAYAPEGRPLPSLVARLAVGEIDKAIQVVGDRSFGLDGRLGDPAPFRRMPLVWERAAGGPGTSNPAGRPLGDAARADFSGRVPAPNLLPVGLHLRSRDDLVPPVGFGPVAPLWPSRAACLHRHVAWWDPSRWHERSLPADIDLGYFNAAPPDQQRALPFGEEVIYLEHLHPRFAHLSTRLASVTPVATVDHGSGPQTLALRCDTLVIDTDRGLAMLVWRAHVVLDHPDRPGRVVVRSPAAPEEALPAWGHNVSDVEATRAPGAFMPSSAVLPFSGAAAPASSSALSPATVGVTAPGIAALATEHAAQRRSSATALPIVDQALDRTQAPGLVVPAAVLPFAFSQGESAPRREARPAESASALPFVPSSARDEGDGPPTARRLDSPEVTSSQATDAPWGASWGSPSTETQPPFAPSSPWATPPEPPRAIAPLPGARAEPLSPYVSSPAASAGPYVPVGSPAVRPAPLFALPPSPASETPAPPPPPLLGAIATVSEGPSEARDSERHPAAEAGASGEAPAAEPELEVVFDAYPPERCGAIAARLACDEVSTGDILRAEDLDAARWKRVHEHWFDRIRDEAARSRKKLLSDYDGAYVRALESQRGPIALDDYARLAEAAERSAVAEVLAERGLPEGAWPHIHRVWIQRMVKDVRLGKQVRAGIDAVRAAG